jgi:hypothetical protein
VPNASRLLASDLDGTLIAPRATPDDVRGVGEFARMVEHAPWPLAYVTGRHRALALDGVRTAGLPLPAFLGCDVGTTVYVLGPDGEYTLDPMFRDEMAESMAGQTSADVRAVLSALPFLHLQPPDRQNEFKVSYDVPDDVPPDAATEVEARLAAAGLALRVVHSRDIVSGAGLVDVLPGIAGKQHTLAYLGRRLTAGPDDVLFAGDSGNDRDALLSGCLGILVSNAEPELAEGLRAEATARGIAARLYLAASPGVRGVIEGCRHFGFA